MAILIRNFGNDTECHTLAEFKKALTEKYIGHEISIVYTLKSGIKTSVFVKVQDDCSLVGSYNDEAVAYTQFNLT